MTDRPILMSGPMVRAILDGRKTQTRRVLKPQPPADFRFLGIYAPHLTAVFTDGNPDHDCVVRLPSKRDRLWVRETWAAPFRRSGNSTGVICRADGPEYLSLASQAHSWGAGYGWKPSIFMPRWASRLTLIVTDVRVQRLQDISEEDALAEGIDMHSDHAELCKNIEAAGYPNDLPNGSATLGMFRALWNSINAKRGFGWSDNPWVVAVTFDPRRENIDRITP